MIVGFTGTQDGMTDRQLQALADALEEVHAVVLHHGDCIGADAQADLIARELGIPVHIHPPTDPKKRGFCYQPGDTIYDPLPYLDRNKKIVDACQLLLVCPKGMAEELRSGTWATYRYAKRIERPHRIIYPREET